MSVSAWDGRCLAHVNSEPLGSTSRYSARLKIANGALTWRGPRLVALPERKGWLDAGTRQLGHSIVWRFPRGIGTQALGGRACNVRHCLALDCTEGDSGSFGGRRTYCFGLRGVARDCTGLRWSGRRGLNPRPSAWEANKRPPQVSGGSTIMRTRQILWRFLGGTGCTHLRCSAL